MAPKRRRLDEGDVGVPVVVIRQIARARLNQSNIRNAIDVRVDRMDVQFAEARGELAMGAGIQRLAFKEKHVPLSHSGGELCNDSLRHRARQIETSDQPADRRSERRNSEAETRRIHARPRRASENRRSLWRTLVGASRATGPSRAQ
jgi:hypothetical protein